MKRLQLRTRYYRSIPIDNPGYEEEWVDLDLEKTALVGMHCWNIGCPDGPPIDTDYCVGMGFPDAIREAGRIMEEGIRPAMDAARRVGMLVCHVENSTIGELHPEAQHDLDDDSTVSGAGGNPLPPVVPGWRQRVAERAHGEEYPTRSPLARMDRAQVVAPLPGEVFVYQTGQFDRALRRHGIENLIYTGFATDMCVLYAPGGVQDMAGRGYRLFLIRDATLGVEYPDTFAERISTRWATRIFEFKFGNSLLLDDFHEALKRFASVGA